MEGMSKQASKEQFPRPRLGLEQAVTPEKFLRSVDFNVINALFDELTRKAAGGSEVHTLGKHVSPENISFNRPHILELLRLRTYEPRSLRGVTNFPQGDIELAWDLKNPKQHRNYRALDLLKTLLHESTHLRGAYKSKGTEQGSFEKEDFEQETQSQMGLETASVRFSLQRGIRTEVQGLSLNEAVTETIAQDLLPEYLIRTGNSGFLKDPRLLQELGPGVYMVDRALLQLVIERLADQFQVDRDIIWRGLVQAYMTGSSAVPELFGEIQMALDYEDKNSFSITRALVSLSESDSAAHIYRVDDVLDFIKGEPELQQAIVDRLHNSIDTEKFGHALGLR